MTQDYSVGLAKYFIDAFRKLTGNPNSIVEISSYNTGDQDFTAQLTNVKNKNPDVIFAPGNYGESALLIRQARDLGIDVPSWAETLGKLLSSCPSAAKQLKGPCSAPTLLLKLR